jgi:hypothetical protein
VARDGLSRCHGSVRHVCTINPLSPHPQRSSFSAPAVSFDHLRLLLSQPPISSKMPGQDAGDKRQAAREVIDILHEIATLLVSRSSDAST